MAEPSKHTAQRVLVLDAQQRSSLAATRSLGKRGITVITADETLSTLAGHSKYGSEQLLYPSPANDADNFIEFLKNAIKTHRIDILLPMTDLTTELILKNRHALSDVTIPLPEYADYETASNKYQLFKQAHALAIPIPATRYFENGEEALAASDDIAFPCVLKPFRSRILEQGNCINTAVKYARSAEELKQVINEHIWLQNYPFMIQAFIQGYGQGIFILLNKGQLVASFAHKRLREKPPSGGVSVLSESVAVPPDMLDIAMRLLEPLQWHGVAMVEFKVSADGTPYLMEINGRFWGSLQLAIDSGVDFPYLLYKIATQSPVQSQTDFQKGIKCRWLLGDLDHLYLKLKSDTGQYSLKEKLLSLCRFMLPYQPGLRYEINRLDDLKPFFHELRQYFKAT